MQSNHSESMPNNLCQKAGRTWEANPGTYLVVILSAFAWAKEFLLPLILAILISFLLTPLCLAWTLEISRAVAVLSVVAIVFA